GVEAVEHRRRPPGPPVAVAGVDQHREAVDLDDPAVEREPVGLGGGVEEAGWKGCDAPGDEVLIVGEHRQRDGNLLLLDPVDAGGADAEAAQNQKIQPSSENPTMATMITRAVQNSHPLPLTPKLPTTSCSAEWSVWRCSAGVPTLARCWRG